MSLTLDIIGFVCVVWLAIIINRQLEISGFKRDPFSPQKLFTDYDCDEYLTEGGVYKSFRSLWFFLNFWPIIEILDKNSKTDIYNG